MKSFYFRMEQVLRWREMQFGLQQARVTVATTQANDLENLLDSRKNEAIAGARQATESPTGASLVSYARFAESSRLHIQETARQVTQARRVVAAEMDRLAAANRRVRLLENLKNNAQHAWKREHEQELGAFADEAFLGQLQRKQRETDNAPALGPALGMEDGVQSRKQTGA